MPVQICFHCIGISNVYFFIVRKLLIIQNENVIRIIKTLPGNVCRMFLKHLNNRIVFFSLLNAKHWHTCTSVMHATDKIKVKQ